MQAQEMERTKISEDLHDQLGNDFIGLKMLTNRLARINESQGYPINEDLVTEIKTFIADMSVNIRQITHTLAQINMEEKGLITLINNRIVLLNTSGNIKFSFKHNGNPETLSSIANIAIFRIMLEAINNIVKHSAATEASLILQIDRNITLTITDNGKGFVIDHIDKGLGLYTMRARTEAMKGTFEIVSGKGNGTNITIFIPTKYHNT